MQTFLDGLIAELPDQSLLAMKSKAAVLFEKSFRLSESHGPGTPVA